MSVYESKGDLFTTNADVIVNPVNLKGVMGAGLAKEFKDRDKQMFENYRQLCQTGEFSRGDLEWDKFHDRKTNRDVIVLNFPTKDDWRNPSDLALIEAGLNNLAQHYDEHVGVNGQPIKSIAMPQIGGGLGGLNFKKDVQPLIEDKFADNPDVAINIVTPQRQHIYVKQTAAVPVATVDEVAKKTADVLGKIESTPRPKAAPVEKPVKKTPKKRVEPDLGL